MIVSDATTAKELRCEIVNYFKLRLTVCQEKHYTGKQKKENEILKQEFKYQIKFWSDLKFREDIL